MTQNPRASRPRKIRGELAVGKLQASQFTESDIIKLIVTLDERVFASLSAGGHQAIADQCGVGTADFYEATWIGDGESGLRVRVYDDDQGRDENWFRAVILAKFPRRSDLIATLVLTPKQRMQLAVRDADEHLEKFSR